MPTTKQKLTVEKKEDGMHTMMTLKGIIDEDANFDSILSNLKPNTFLSLEGIHMINSCGVREWVHAMKKIPQSVKLHLEKCTPRIVEQVNYVANFLGSATINSFYAPYFCPNCRAEATVLLHTKDLPKDEVVKAPDHKCPECRSAMEFDDIEEEYFSFLKQQV